MERLSIALCCAAIRLYQLTLSPLLGNCCRFTPSCSAYARQALREHGLWAGSWMAVKRVCRCHPFHPGGYDPVVPRQRAADAPNGERA